MPKRVSLLYIQQVDARPTGDPILSVYHAGPERSMPTSQCPDTCKTLGETRFPLAPGGTSRTHTHIEIRRQRGRKAEVRTEVESTTQLKVIYHLKVDLTARGIILAATIKERAVFNLRPEIFDSNQRPTVLW